MSLHKESCVRVSVRLKGIWASALVASFAVIQTPAMTYGQTNAATAAQTTASQATFAGEANNDEAAKKVLLKARQALAQSDLRRAADLLGQASSIEANYEALGDSPATIQSLIDRQNQLAAMAERRDPEYNAGAASFFLVQAEALLYYQDFDNAEALIKHARAFNVKFNDRIGDPDRLQNLLEVARSRVQVQTPTASNDAIAQTRRLLSMAQLAFDKGQVNEAKALVEDAKKLKVDETLFAANEMRTWQMELKIQKVLGGSAAMPSDTKFDSSVQATQFELEDENVAQASYDPSNDTTKNVQVGFSNVRQDKDATNGSFAPIPSTPMEYYRAGLKAIADQNSEEARNYLIRAWEGRLQLDDVTQQSIQDQLARLNITNSNAKPATANLQRGQKAIQAFREIQKEVFSERMAAEQLLKKSPRQALEKLAMVRNRIGQSQLDAAQQSPLLKMVDRDMEEFQKYIEENLADIETEERNRDNKDIVERRRQRRADVERQLQSLVEDYNRLTDEQRFAEAEVIASQAYDLAPGSEIAVLLHKKAQFKRRIAQHELIKAQKEAAFLDATASSNAAAITSVTTENPWTIQDPEVFARNGNIRSRRLQENRYSSEAEARIWNLLKNEQVQGDYRGSLRDALQQLATTSGVNIIMDEIALATAQVNSDTQVNVPIGSPISLRSALQIILEQKGLVFEVDNEVIKVTTKEAQSTNLEAKTYYIGDLVMPLDTPRNPMAMDWMSPSRSMGANGGSMNVQNAVTSQPQSQMALAQQLGGGLPGLGNPLAGNYGSNNGPQRGEALYNTQGSRQLGGVTLNDFQPLLELIQSTIDQETWQGGGGEASILPYVQNLSLVVSAPQETQDKIQDLLRKLRELNDVQIVVEVRFVTLQDNFFERVGIDFDFSINDNTQGVTTNATGDQVLVGGGSGVVGRQPVETTPFTPTQDFDIGFLQGNFNAAEPLFGGFTAASAASFGFAILSDIEVFFLLQASKGNNRTNITQAPTVTMFNGQSASVSDFASRPFVTSVVPVVGDFAVAHQPVITLLPDGTNLNVQAVVSSDRQFVKLRLVPYFTQVTEVNTFTFNGSQETERTTNSVLDDLLDIVDGGANADGGNEELLTRQTGITVQQPVLAVTNVSTVVSVPDGGTVLMGGIKRMREGRNESGVPFLSNVPYVNRLFKNVGIGHETQHLMMMVTPRIIIQKEIEEDMVGGRN